MDRDRTKAAELRQVIVVSFLCFKFAMNMQSALQIQVYHIASFQFSMHVVSIWLFFFSRKSDIGYSIHFVTFTFWLVNVLTEQFNVISNIAQCIWPCISLCLFPFELASETKIHYRKFVFVVSGDVNHHRIQVR